MAFQSYNPSNCATPVLMARCAMPPQQRLAPGRTSPRPRSRKAHPAPSPMLREFLDRIVASVFSVDTTLLKLPTRGRRPIAEARQVAMYLAHVALGLSLTDVGRLFERDRTTVAHACKKIEDRREAAEFDKALDLLERSIRMVQLTEKL